MNPSPLSNCPAEGRPQLRHAAWTPPEWLVEVAPDDDRFIAEMVEAFRTSTETSLRQMRIALAASDVPRLRSEAHKTKGGASQIGVGALAEVCQSLEDASSLTPVSLLAELLDRCQELFDQAGRAMTAYSSRKLAVDDSGRL